MPAAARRQARVAAIVPPPEQENLGHGQRWGSRVADGVDAPLELLPRDFSNSFPATRRSVASKEAILTPQTCWNMVRNAGVLWSFGVHGE